jgi:hypothetical protein
MPIYNMAWCMLNMAWCMVTMPFRLISFYNAFLQHGVVHIERGMVT